MFEDIEKHKFYSGRVGPEKFIEISLDLNSHCNYDCPYCYAKMFYKDTKTKYEMDYDKAMYILDCFKGVNYSIRLNLLGGEPMLYSRVNDFVQEASKLKEIERVRIFSNGSIPINKIEQNEKVSFLFTYHPYDVKNDFEFVKNVSKTKKKDIELIFSPRSLAFAKKYSFLDPSINFPTRGFKNPKLDERGAFLSHKDITYNGKLYSQYEMFSQHMNRFKGWYCLLNMIMLNVYGNIYVFCEDDYKEPRANIFKDPDFFRNFELEPCICPKDFCSMPVYLYRKKWKD